MTMFYLPRFISSHRVAFVLGVTALAFSSASQAAPRGPSARKAAKLAKSAPGWLSHYLPEDRYKIGAAWKFVATDLDTYYHRPDSPNMLRQSAERVIGFASAKDAEEAGYLPDPSDGTASMAARAKSQSANSSIGKRITLADGKSTVLLPNGWKHGTTPVGRTATSGETTATDSMIYIGAGGVWIVAFSINSRPGYDYAKDVTPQALKAAAITAANTPTNLPINLKEETKNAKYKLTTWAGLKGAMATTTDNPNSIAVRVARGSKRYSYVSTGPSNASSPPGLSEMLTSFRPG